jgi:hypothetical protein
MACCGQQRARLSLEGQLRTSPRKAERPSVVLFRYAGMRTLTAVGAVTGKRYYFPATGAKVQVDALDLHSISAVPELVRS